MSRYRQLIEVLFPVSRESGKWEHDTLEMPACLAGWLDTCGFSGVVNVSVCCTIRGKYTGFDGDDSHEFVCHGATAYGASPIGTLIPDSVLNCALSGEWESAFNEQLMDARQSACVAI